MVFITVADVTHRGETSKKHVRKKYRCRCGGSPKLAPGPLRLPGGGRYSLDFAIEAAVAKHLDHTPLERQVRIMRREGLDIDSSTLWEQCERLARVLGLTAAAIRQYVVQALVVHADETPWYMLKKVPARARKPRDKAQVEGGVLIVQRWERLSVEPGQLHRQLEALGSSECPCPDAPCERRQDASGQGHSFILRVLGLRNVSSGAIALELSL
ncbi:MAG: hypothetical protein JWN04_212 [Myxococcaceae bacterium]|nr:hypothetical protein [Myxococcaceae bacterium]